MNTSPALPNRLAERRNDPVAAAERRSDAEATYGLNAGVVDG